MRKYSILTVLLLVVALISSACNLTSPAMLNAVEKALKDNLPNASLPQEAEPIKPVAPSG